MSTKRDGKRASGWGRFSLKKTGFLTIFLIVAGLPGIGCSMTGSETTRGPLVGGPCEYRSYPGQAEIVSVAPWAASAAAADERFDVKFRFISDGPVDEPLGRAALERTFSLLPDREMPPATADIDTFALRPGIPFRSALRARTGGTWTRLLSD